MRRFLLVLVAILIVVSSAMILRSGLKTRAKKKREVSYQSIVQAYSRDFQPGTNRKDVESKLQARKVRILQMCCIEERSANADLLQIGKEDAPWFCSENYVYVAFEFMAQESHDRWKSYDSDVLTKVRLYSRLGGCL